MVGDEVASTEFGMLSQAEVERHIAAAGDAGVALRTEPGPSSGPTGPNAVTGTTVVAQGGVVTFRCRASTISAEYTLARGYSGSRATDLDGTYIEVNLRNGTRRSTVEGHCRRGVPATNVHESDESDESDDD